MTSAATFLAKIERLVPDMQDRAVALDAACAFPAEDLAAIHAAGGLDAPFTPGLGTRPDTPLETLAFFRLLGRGNPSLGRLMEAHVNAVRLVVRYADPALQSQVRQDCTDGRLIALWVTDPPRASLHWRDGALHGNKQFCSGAGRVSRAVVTVERPDGGIGLAYAALEHGVAASPLPGGLAGMRAAGTGQMQFSGAVATLFGRPGDYLREPDFSCGAWRTSAVTLGGLEALQHAYRSQLRARARQDDPHQQARFGQALLAVETARLWMAEAATRAENFAPDSIPYVGLARLAVERACLDVIEHVQRSLGAAAFLRSNPVERMCRDLATYLRQPAGDMVLTEAAAASLAGAA